MAQFYAIIPAGRLTNLSQIEDKFAFNHFATHRATKQLLVYVNEGDPGSFDAFIADDPQLSATTTDPALPLDFSTHWEQILQPGTDLLEINDNFVNSSADFVTP